MKYRSVSGRVTERASPRDLLPEDGDAAAPAVKFSMPFAGPVLNTDLPMGVPEISRKGETGLTVRAGIPVAFANAMYTMLSDPERRYSRSALARAKEHSVERFLTGVRRVYPDFLERRQFACTASEHSRSRFLWRS